MYKSYYSYHNSHNSYYSYHNSYYNSYIIIIYDGPELAPS